MEQRDRFLQTISNRSHIHANLHAPNLIAVNLIHFPSEQALEAAAVQLFLDKGVKGGGASASWPWQENTCLLSSGGLSRECRKQIVIGNKVIAKISKGYSFHWCKRHLRQLCNPYWARESPRQAELAKQVSMADDITVEADFEVGITDNRP